MITLKRMRDELFAWWYRRELKQLNETLDKMLVEARKIKTSLNELQQAMRWD